MRFQRAWWIALLIVILPCAASDPQRPTTRKTLDQPTEIDGYPCAKGYAFVYTNSGRLSQCSVSRDVAIGATQVPAGSLVRLAPDGEPLYVMLIHDSPIGEVKCKGGGLLGPGEGASTALYPSGKLKECFLTGDQRVQGVPCMGGRIIADVFGGGSGTFFYESGKLRSCKLSANFGSQHKGDRFSQRE
jgi:hypothetical protein